MALNSKEAENRTTNADIASESANLTQSSILQQTATAILAQANQQPNFVTIVTS